MEGGEAGVVAVTKVFAIRVRLDDRVRYITDGEKTSLASSITYISNPEKTEQFFFTSALNCSSVDTALSEMMETKQQFGKMGGVLGYHFIQSFQPGEVTPEQAHAIGLEFAKRLFGKRYEVVISTHLNKHHLHNHLVVNSVSCVDGQKYRTLADNLSTSKVYVLDARPAVLGLAANERVTEVMFVFGNVKAGFAQVETPYIYTTARSGLANNSGIVNVADVGGLYNGQWIQAVSRWLTTVYTKTTVKLPKTGY